MHRFIISLTFLALSVSATGSGIPEDALQKAEKLRFTYDVTRKTIWQGVSAAEMPVTVNDKTLHVRTNKPKAHAWITLPAVPVREGAGYRLQFQVKNDSPGMGYFTADLYFYMNGDKQVYRVVRDFAAVTARKGEWLNFDRSFQLPLSGATTMKARLCFAGSNFNLSFRNPTFQEVPDSPIEHRFAAAKQLFTAPGVQIWNDLPHVQTAYAGLPPNLSSGILTLSAARNEREATQIVLSPTQTLPRVTFEFQALKSTDGASLPASIFRARSIGFIELPAQAGPRLSGQRADPLLPDAVFDAPGTRNTPVYLTLDVPRDAKPGLYHTRILVKSNGKKVAELPLELKVRSFTLPDKPTLRTMFYARQEEFRHYDKNPKAEVIDHVYRLLREHRINGNQGEALPMPEYRLLNGTLNITDWSAFDAFVQRRIDRDGQTVFCLPYLYFFGDTGGFYKNKAYDRSKVFGGVGFDSAQGQQYLADYARQLDEHVRQKFPQAEFYAYLWDEPRHDNQAQLVPLLRAVKKGAPRMKTFITAPPVYALQYPGVDVWCEPLDLTDDTAQSRKIAPGAEFWIYNWPTTLAPLNYLEIRLYAAKVYASGSKGALLWQIFDSPQHNAWKNLSKTYGYGAATLLYPPRRAGEDFIDSQRFAVIREAIDDFDYLTLLEARYEQRQKGSGKAKVRSLLREILPGANMIHRNDPALWQRLRDRIANEIEATGKDIR